MLEVAKTFISQVREYRVTQTDFIDWIVGFTSEAGRPPFTKRVVDYVETQPFPFACEVALRLGTYNTFHFMVCAT